MCDRRNKTVLVSLISLLIAIISMAVAFAVFLDRKKKKEDQEIDDYLDNSIQ